MCSNKVLWIIIICFFAAFIANLSVSTCWMCHLEKILYCFGYYNQIYSFLTKKQLIFFEKPKFLFSLLFQIKPNCLDFYQKKPENFRAHLQAQTKQICSKYTHKRGCFFVVFWTDSLCFIRESWINNEILNVSIVYQNKTSSLQTNFHSSININELKKDLLKESF